MHYNIQKEEGGLLVNLFPLSLTNDMEKALVWNNKAEAEEICLVINLDTGFGCTVVDSKEWVREQVRQIGST